MFRAIQFVLVAVVLFGTCAVAQAESIPLLKNVTTDSVIFHDDFESGTVGSPPGQYDPTVGEWTSYSPGTNGSYAWVTDEATTGVASYEGSQYLDVYRGPLVSSSSVLQGFGIASGAGDVVMFQAAFYGSPALIFMDAAGGHLGRVWAEPGGAFLVRDSGNANWLTLDQTWTAGQWNTLVVTHTNQTQDWTISVNGQTPETETSLAAGATGAVSGIFLMSSTYSGGAYLDALPIPEPGTLALLATGLIGLLCYAWRKRK